MFSLVLTHTRTQSHSSSRNVTRAWWDEAPAAPHVPSHHMASQSLLHPGHDILSFPSEWYNTVYRLYVREFEELLE